MSTEDTIQEFAPALRTSSQSEAFCIALQMLGDLTGFGIYAWARIMLGNGTQLRSDAQQPRFPPHNLGVSDQRLEPGHEVLVLSPVRVLARVRRD